jgi:hypothetical protein
MPALLLLLIINMPLFANDTRTTGLGGSVKVINNENTNVIMQEEVINITLHKKYYEVDVTFDFYNSGADEKILLGFPVKTEGWEKLYVKDFKSYINGNMISEYIIKEDTLEEYDAYKEFKGFNRSIEWYLREVMFPGNKHTYSRVTYNVPYSDYASIRYAGYIYGTGRNWKGKIGKMTINISHGDDILIDGVFFGEPFENFGNFFEKDKKYNFKYEASGKYKYVLENIEPEISDCLSVVIKSFDIYGEYNGEFGAEPHGDWLWSEHLMYQNEKQIKLYTKNQIRMLINFFFAIHGYDFKNPLYKNYFKNVDFYYEGHKGYKVNPKFSEKDFNEFERKNIDYLLQLEKMIP